MRTTEAHSFSSDSRPSLSPEDATAGDMAASRKSSNTTARTVSHSYSTSPSSFRPTTSTSSQGSPGKHSSIHPHYCPAQYHAAPSEAELAERHRSDNEEQHWDNVFLNSHLSVDAWKSQSKVVKKASQQQHSASEDDDDVHAQADDEEESGLRTRARGRRRQRRQRSSDKPQQAGESPASSKKNMSWKLRGMNWAIGVSGV